MSLKSIMLIVLALLFFAAGGYLFYNSTRECMRPKDTHAQPIPDAPAGDPARAPVTTPAPD